MQVKDLVVTGDARILGNIYTQNGPISGGLVNSSGGSGSSGYTISKDSNGTVTLKDGSGNSCGSFKDDDTKYNLSAASSNLGGVKSGGDVTISDGIITVNDDSHNHIIANVDGLQTALDGKSASGHTHNYAGSASAGGAANSVKTSLTFNNGGAGASSGTTFNGSTARTISYNTIGAASASSLTNVTSTLTTHTNASNPHSDSMAKNNPEGTGRFHFGHQHSFNTSAGVTHGYAFGGCNSITGDYGVAMGNYVIASTNQLVIGHYSKSGLGSLNGTSGTAFVIGNGSSGSQSQALRVSYAGDLYTAKGTINSGADYAEYFEWKDQNVLSEDRRGYFVTLEENKIKIAQSKDYILGVISGQPSIIGNGDEDWQGRFIKDDFGAYIEEHFEYEIEELDEATNQIIKKKESGTKWKENPEYDATKEYIQRADRPEWDAVGMLGVLAVRDDGTCEVNGYCGVTDGGIATKAETGYRVIERVNDHIVKIVFR